MGRKDGRRQIEGRREGKAGTHRHTEADMFQKAQIPETILSKPTSQTQPYE